MCSLRVLTSSGDLSDECGPQCKSSPLRKGLETFAKSTQIENFVGSRAIASQQLKKAPDWSYRVWESESSSDRYGVMVKMSNGETIKRKFSKKMQAKVLKVSIELLLQELKSSKFCNNHDDAKASLSKSEDWDYRFWHSQSYDGMYGYMVKKPEGKFVAGRCEKSQFSVYVLKYIEALKQEVELRARLREYISKN